jgi:ParB/RepB/Spo0J family partition protein
MKLKVKDLSPNPFRNIENYPINREKVDALKTSINQTSFWDNIVARKNGRNYQIAYGHHRLIALKEIGISEVDIPVRDLDDATMLRMMADENLFAWRNNTKVMNETVLAANEFLNAELAKYDSWEKFKKSHLINLLDGSRKEDFKRLKNQGVGQTDNLRSSLG